MECERCKKPLNGKQERWCCLRCSKLGLKSLYKKRNKDKINEYNRKYKGSRIRGHSYGNKTLKKFLERNKECAKCGTIEKVQIAMLSQEI